MYVTVIDEHKDNCFLTTVEDAGVVVDSVELIRLRCHLIDTLYWQNGLANR
jgi:hypothetical protein